MLQLKPSKNRLLVLFSEDCLAAPCYFFPSSGFHTLNNGCAVSRPLLKFEDNDFKFYHIPQQKGRGMAILVGRIIRGVFKIRYLILGGALSGGYTVQKVGEIRQV